MKSRELYAGYNVGWLYVYALNMGSRDSGGYDDGLLVFIWHVKWNICCLRVYIFWV